MAVPCLWLSCIALYCASLVGPCITLFTPLYIYASIYTYVTYFIWHKLLPWSNQDCLDDLILFHLYLFHSEFQGISLTVPHPRTYPVLCSLSNFLMLISSQKQMVFQSDLKFRKNCSQFCLVYLPFKSTIILTCCLYIFCVGMDNLYILDTILFTWLRA